MPFSPEPYIYPYVKSLSHINTGGSNYNGYVRPIVNSLIPGTNPIAMAYLTYCAPKGVKGPHMHLPPKEDRFVCVEGECIVVCRSEQEGASHEMFEFVLDADDRLLTIPPLTSHAIASKDGALILSLPNEAYYPGHYNQVDTEYLNYDWERWFE